MIRQVALAWVLMVSSAWAALPATTVFEVHPANGNDTFGACYDTATVVTDYSNQDTAQLTLTDCATSGIGITTVTSVTGGFTAAMVGNCIRIDSGTNVTAGFYMITSRTDTNTIAVDRAPDNGGGGISAGACKVGGAAKTFESATTNDLSDALVTGAKVWVKNEAWNEAVTLTTGGSVANPVIIEGYNSTRGDAPTGATRPTNDRASGAGDAFNIATSTVILRYLIGKSAGGDGFDNNSTGDGVFWKCRGTANGGVGFRNSQNSRSNATFFDVEGDTNTSVGFSEGGGSGEAKAAFVYAHDNTSNGMNLAIAASIVGAISEANASHGFFANANQAHTLINCVLDGNTGAATDGVNVGTGTELSITILNNIISNNGDDGMQGGTIAAMPTINYNNVYGNGTAYEGFTAGANDLTTDPSFTNRAGQDFTLASGSGALGAGFPQTIPGATGDYQWNIGVDQDDVCAAGGAGGWGF